MPALIVLFTIHDVARVVGVRSDVGLAWRFWTSAWELRIPARANAVSEGKPNTIPRYEGLTINWSWATQMKRFIDWGIFFIMMSVASLLAFGLHAWIHLNFWACLGIVVFGILLNGIIGRLGIWPRLS